MDKTTMNGLDLAGLFLCAVISFLAFMAGYILAGLGLVLGGLCFIASFYAVKYDRVTDEFVLFLRIGAFFAVAFVVIGAFL